MVGIFPVDDTTVVDGSLQPGMARAGKSIPFRFFVFDAQGRPVRNITTASGYGDRHKCGAGRDVDRIERYTSQRPALVHLGQGEYQYALKTRASWAGTCRTVGINLGDGVRHGAEFRFMR